jgi:FkbM family methyltransferase
MNIIIQRLLLNLYSIVQKLGIFKLPLARAIFILSYNYYKSIFESVAADRLKSFVKPNTLVIDVGANVGFYTIKFAAWSKGVGSVIAIEPEEQNFASLVKSAKKRRVAKKIEFIRGVAADSDGELKLEINPNHPGDHKISNKGEPIASYKIDTLLAKRKSQAVSLIKIDTQGAEALVLKGASKTIKEFKPVIFIEIDEAMLKLFGASPESLLRPLENIGYEFSILNRKGISFAMNAESILKEIARRRIYIDILCHCKS